MIAVPYPTDRDFASERFSLAVALDTQYFAPICRDYDDLSQRRDIDHACHDEQLDLFEVGDVAF